MAGILDELARIYQSSPRGRRGGAGDYTIDYEKLLRLAGAADGDEREIAELELRRAEADSRGLLRVERHKRSNLPERIRLGAEGGEAWLFAAIGGISPGSKRLELSGWFMQTVSQEVPLKWRQAWARHFSALADAALAGGSILPFRRDDPEGNRMLAAALAGVLGWRGPSLIRYASSAICGDSKKLQSLEPRLRLLLEAVTGMSSLEDFGILRKPRSVTFHGPLVLVSGGVTSDFGSFPGPVSLTETNFTPDTRISTRAPVCLTVENEDTFHELAATNPGVLLILTGYAGSAVRRLIALLPQETRFIHFGDVDPAGFDILRDLQAKTGRDIRVLEIAPDAPRSPIRRVLGDADLRMLERLLESDLPASVRPAMEALMESGSLGEFEQESIPVERVWKRLGEQAGFP